jgi:acyl-CoA synthetase (AMP-forming)/AMP-acid ligase II/acyl carrier protein
MNNFLKKTGTLVELLCLRAQNQSDKQAYLFLKNGEIEESSLTYSQLDRKARIIAAKLQEISTVSERVLLLYPPGLDFIAAFFGCLYAGVVAVPTYPPRRNRSDPRIQAIVTDAQATIVLTTANIFSDITPRLAYAPELKKLHWLATDNLPNDIADHWQMPKIQSETLAFLQYTSGSTGTPKGVMVSHSNLLHNLKALDLELEHTSNSVMVTWLPIFHDMGLIYGILQPLYKGFSCYIMAPIAFVQKPIRWLQAISYYQATHSAAPNFAYELCIRRTTPQQRTILNLSHWRVALNGAEPIRENTLKLFADTFKPYGFNPQAFCPGYGLAEATLKVTAVHHTDNAIFLPINTEVLVQQHHLVEISHKNMTNSNHVFQTFVGCGHSESDNQIVIVNPESLVQCTPTEVGEIWVSGPSVAQGYWNNPEATKQTFQAYLANTGEGPFLRTGDLGFLKNGELFVTGRLKDLIIIRGRNYYPQDIEFTVEKSHSALVSGSSAAFSVEMKGEERLVIAQEVQRTALKNLNANEIVNVIREAVFEQYEIGVDIILLLKTGSIPKTSSGKIQRRACREQFLTNQLKLVGEWRQTTLIDSEHTPSPSQEGNKTEHISSRNETGGSPLLRGDLGVCLSDYTAPRTPIEEKLAQLWAEVLGIEKVGIEDNFFELGGDSLLATQFLSRVRDDFQIELPLRHLFEKTTVANLAEQIDKLMLVQKLQQSNHKTPLNENGYVKGEF